MVLTERRSGWHISMFLPMHQSGVETLQNPVRCKNLLRQAEEHLLAGGVRPPQAQEWLAPVQRLLADYDFWQHQSAGRRSSTNLTATAIIVGPTLAGIRQVRCIREAPTAADRTRTGVWQ